MMRLRNGKNEKESKRSERCPEARQSLGNFDSGAELVKRQCWSRRTTKKNRGSDKHAVKRAGQRKQLNGGNPRKVEAAKRGRQN